MRLSLLLVLVLSISNLRVPGLGYEVQTMPEPSLTSEQVVYLSIQARNLDIECKDLADWKALADETDSFPYDEVQNAKFAILQKEVYYCLYSDNLPTKANLLKAIISPEKWHLRFGPEVLMRSNALALLAVNNNLESCDLPVIQQSFATATHWQSKIWAINLITKLDRKKGLDMTESFILSFDFHVKAKIALLVLLHDEGVELEYWRFESILAQAINCPYLSVKHDVQTLLDFLSNNEKTQKIVTNIFAQAEKENAKINQQLADIKSEYHERHISESKDKGLADKHKKWEEKRRALRQELQQK